ncbi:MAG: DUF3310 domain-containing protein [Telluria sp.]
MISEAFGPTAHNDDFDHFETVIRNARMGKPRATVTAEAAVLRPQDKDTYYMGNVIPAPTIKPTIPLASAPHYACMPIDVFTYATANNMDPIQFSVVKYVSRFKSKNGLEDLIKARDCIDRLIKHHYPQGQ